LTATTVVEGNIVEASDLQAPLSGFQRFTLLRVRGWLSFSKDPVNTANSGIFIIILDE